MKKTLDTKLDRMRKDPAGCKDFILCDAKDADMAYGLMAPGSTPDGKGGSRKKTLEDYLAQIRSILKQGKVDIMLCSASNIERLAVDEKLFTRSPVTPMARANDTSDIWCVRDGSYPKAASRPFSSASISQILQGTTCKSPEGKKVLPIADLGLYSTTFCNDRDLDLANLEAFKDFREECEWAGFRYVWEVFDPNVACGVSDVAGFVNDHITRTLAGVVRSARPILLKIVYHGPAAMEELVSYDSSLLVGILGGGAGTTFDAFHLLAEAKKYGARAAFFGRKINGAEDPLSFVEVLRSVADGETSATDAVKLYHDLLKKKKIAPARPLAEDLLQTTTTAKYGQPATAKKGKKTA